MQRGQFTIRLIAVPALGLGAFSSARALSEGDAAAGVRAALERGANAAVNLLGRSDRFLGNPQVRIELPDI